MDNGAALSVRESSFEVVQCAAQLIDLSVAGALGEEPAEEIAWMILARAFAEEVAVANGTVPPPEAAASPPQSSEEAARNAAEAEQQARWQAEWDRILASMTAAIKTDPNPADYGERRSRIDRLEAWLGRAAMRARIGKEPSADIIRDLRAGLGLVPADDPRAGPPAAGNGHDPP